MTGPTRPEDRERRPGESIKSTVGDQSTPEKQGEALRARGVQPSSASASGHAAAGSPTPQEDYHTPGEGAEEIQDTMLKPGKPVGKQAEPAIITATGSVESGTIPSPSGPVPAAAVGDDRLREAAVRAAQEGLTDAQQTQRNSRRRLTQEDVDRMSPAEVRAVASNRGYDIPVGGRRSTGRHFLAAQEEDQTLEEKGGLTPSERRQSTEASRTPPRPAAKTARTAADLQRRPPGPGGQPGSSVRVPAPGTTAAATPPSRPTPPAGSGIEGDNE